jgi:hypothetical protein
LIAQVRPRVHRICAPRRGADEEREAVEDEMESQIDFLPSDKWWITLQHRVIELTGRAIEDLTPERLNSLRIRRLTEIEQRALETYELSFPRTIITQVELRAALSGPDRLWETERIRLVLADGVQVEPGPIIAFLRWYEPDATHNYWAFEARIRERQQHARTIGGQR